MRRRLSSGRPRSHSAARDVEPSAPITIRVRTRRVERPSFTTRDTPSASRSMPAARRPLKHGALPRRARRRTIQASSSQARHHAPEGRQRADLGQRAGDEHLSVHGEGRAANLIGRRVVRPDLEAQAGELGQGYGADEVAAHLVAGERLLVEQPDAHARPAEVCRCRRAGGARADDRDVTVERTDGARSEITAHGAVRGEA